MEKFLIKTYQMRLEKLTAHESDVNFKVVSSFVSKVKDKASGSKVLDSITPGKQFVKIVLDEMISFLNSKESKIT